MHTNTSRTKQGYYERLNNENILGNYAYRTPTIGYETLKRNHKEIGISDMSPKKEIRLVQDETGSASQSSLFGSIMQK